MNNDGTFDERPEGAAPLFDSEIGRKAALKRWKNYIPPDKKPDITFGSEKEFGIVYFVYAEVENKLRVKIGVTTDLQKRFSALRTGSPIKLELGLGIIVQNPRSFEKSLHRRFASKRIRGEWFDITMTEALEALASFYDKL